MDILSKLGVSISGPFAGTIDEAIRGILKQFGLEDDLEKVSGDNEKLQQTADDYRQAARDLRGVVDDLEAERKKLLKTWDGEAAQNFQKKSLAFEKALTGEAEDMDTIATLLETAAEACAEAEQMMIDLIIEIIEAVIAAAATTAILSVLTAGAAAAIGPLITAAGIATKAMKAVKITAKLADKLSDIAKRLKAIKRAEKLAKELKRFGGKGNDSYRKGLARYRGKLKDGDGNAIPGSNDLTDIKEFAAYAVTKRGIKRGVVAPVIGVETGDVIKEGYDQYAPSNYPGAAPKEPTAYDQRPESESFNDRMNSGMTNKQKVKEDFG
ncbi:WXG100 family type VII secretion target [Streptomyces ovatisporus]|uniref:WXG100 family type VII secretion target n=1 Tax=Streptomyces ovatisporus TaxID=1128682 RepID=A0ABV9AF42_9ACTN